MPRNRSGRDDSIAGAINFGLSGQAIEYLRQPIWTAHYVALHGVAEDALNRVVKSGQMRSVVCRDAVWVDGQIEPPASPSAAEQFLTSSLEGNLGLAMTCWVYGAVGSLVLASMINRLSQNLFYLES